MKVRQAVDQPIATRPPVKRVVLFLLAFGVAIAVIIGLTFLLIYNSAARSRRDSKAVLAGVTVKPFFQLAADNTFPMGLVAVSDGPTSTDSSGGSETAFYLTEFGTGAVMKVDAQGNAAAWPEVKGQIHAGGSLAIGPDKAVYLVDFSATDPRSAQGSIRRIETDGKTALFGLSPTGQPLSLPLFSQMAFDAAGNLYVTDPASTRVWQIAQTGNAIIWWTAPSLGTTRAQPTGIAYNKAHNAMIVADAGTGSVYRLDLTNGPAANPLVLYRQAGADIQNVALDDQGRVLLSIWDHDNGQLARLELDGRLTLLADNFRAPTAIVYRNNKVFVVNSDLLGLVPRLFGVIPSPLRARPPFTVDVVDLSGASVASPTGTPVSATLLMS